MPLIVFFRFKKLTVLGAYTAACMYGEQLFPRRYRFFDVATAPCHFQLRDTVQVGSWAPHTIVVIDPSGAIRELNIQTGVTSLITRPARPPHQRINALACHQDLVLAAGDGFISVASRDTQPSPFEVRPVGAGLNNSVCCWGQQPHALLGNNDGTAYLGIPGARGQIWTDLSELTIGDSVNHCSVSPDGNLAAFVCDSPELHLYHALNGGYDFHPLAVTVPDRNFKAEVGLGVDFSPSGLYLAAAFEQGQLAIWDVRQIGRSPLKLVNTDAQLRTCKFSGISEDLLFVSEYDNRVWALDMRDLDNYQSMNLPIFSGGNTPPRHGDYADLPEKGEDRGPCDIRGIAWCSPSLVVAKQRGILAIDVDERKMLHSFQFR